MSIPSHKSTNKKLRPVQIPQRSNGVLRVAAILDAAAAVFDEKGYEAATTAEIAVRSDTRIGSLYRFFPNKQSLADVILSNGREHLDAAFEKFNGEVRGLKIATLADNLMSLVFELFTRPGVVRLLDAEDWSTKREEFRQALQKHIAKALRTHTPGLSARAASDAAFVVLLNVKSIARHRGLFDPGSNVVAEVREMTRLYLQSKLNSKGAA